METKKIGYIGPTLAREIVPNPHNSGENAVIISPNLKRDDVKALQTDANKLIKSNSKKYSIIRTSGVIQNEQELARAHRPSEGYITVPPEVARKMANHSGSKFIRGQQMSGPKRLSKKQRAKLTRDLANKFANKARVSDIKSQMNKSSAQRKTGDK
jgi:hypothetical protein